MLTDLLSQQERETLTQSLPVGQIPLWQYWPEFVEKYLRTGKSEVTVSGVRDGLLFMMRKLNILTLEDFNNPRLFEDKLFAYKEEHHISANTFNSYRKYANTFGIWLEMMEYIKENRIKKVQKCKVEWKEHLTLDYEQVRQVVGQMHDRKHASKLERLRNVFLIDLIRYTGARPCEIIGIKVQDITKKNGMTILAIQGRKQKGRIRYYSFCEYLQDSYEAYMEVRGTYRKNEEKLLISMSRHEMGLTLEGIKYLFNRISKELGFRITPYSFRRYVATHLYEQDMPLQKISDYLGHHRVTTTLRYIERTCALTKDCSKIMGM